MISANSPLSAFFPDPLESSARAVFREGDPGDPPRGLRLALLDGSLDVDVRYQGPRMDSNFDPGLLRVNLPEDVRIRDFRR